MVEGVVAALFVLIALDYGTNGRLGWAVSVAQLSLFAVGIWQGQASLGSWLDWPFLVLYSALGIVLGYGLYALSSLATHVTPKEVVAYFMEGKGFFRFYRERSGVALSYLFMAYFEEVLWRAIVQGALTEILSSQTLGVLIAAAFFTMMHFRYFIELPIRWAEFFVFSLVLGVLYASTGSLFLVTLVHFLRNLHVTFFGHWDEQQAQTEQTQP